MPGPAVRKPVLLTATALVLLVGVWWLWQATLLGAEPLVASHGVFHGAAALGPGPTAVVLGDFSASIQGPSDALWSLSIALIVIGVLIVQYRYRQYWTPGPASRPSAPPSRS